MLYNFFYNLVTYLGGIICILLGGNSGVFYIYELINLKIGFKFHLYRYEGGWRDFS